MLKTYQFRDVPANWSFWVDGVEYRKTGPCRAMRVKDAVVCEVTETDDVLIREEIPLSLFGNQVSKAEAFEAMVLSQDGSGVHREDSDPFGFGVPVPFSA